MQIPTRTLSELFNVGMNSLAASWRSLVAPAVAASLVLGVVSIVALGATGSLEFFELVFNDPGARDSMTSDELAELFYPLMIAAGIGILAQMLAFSFISVATHTVIAGSMNGRLITGGEASRYAFARLPTVIVANIIIAVLVIGGLILFVVPGIWVGGSVAVVMAVVALEPTGPTRAIGRSFHLVRGRWWQTVGFVLIVGLIAGVSMQLVQFVAVPLLAVGTPGPALGLIYVFGVLVQGLVTAAVAAMITFLYIDLRTRKEPLTAEDLFPSQPRPL